MKQLYALVLIITIALGLMIGCNKDCATQEKEEQNKETIRRIHAEAAKGNLAIFSEMLASNYVRHCQAMPPGLQELHGTEQFVAFLEDFYNGVSDFTDSISVMVAEGDMVAYVSTMTCKHTGTMNGIPATGKEFVIVNLVMQRFENGKIAETWVSWDNMAVMAQLGLLPPPPDDGQ